MDCENCPYKKQIDKNSADIILLRKNLTDQDKQSAVFQMEIRTQYQTILNTIIEQNKTNQETARKVIELEKKEVLNNYKTNKSTAFMESLSPAKIIAFSVSILTILIGIKELFL